MSGPSTPGGSPFEHLLGDLLRVLRQGDQSPIQWELARQFAANVATDGASEPNVDPLERMRLEQLGRVAELHVASVTGLRTSRSAASVSMRPVGRAEWALTTLDAWRPLLDSLSRSLRPDAQPAAGEGQPEEGLAGLLGSLGQVMGPAMMGLQFGSALGHLSRRAFGQYDFPLPRPAGDELLVVAANVDEFAGDWSLPPDDVRLWICVNEISHHAVLSLPHVRDRLSELLRACVAGVRPDLSGLESRLTGVDPTDLDSLQSLFGSPAALLEEMESPERAHARSQLEALVAAMEGWVDRVSDTVGSGLIASWGSLAEAVRRRRVERSAEEQFIEQLFGLELSQAAFDRGTAFVRGIVERAGNAADAELSLLWSGARTLPTPAEVDAPGLWLERVHMDEDGHRPE